MLLSSPLTLRAPPQARPRMVLSRQSSPLHARFSLEARDGHLKVLASQHSNPVLVSQSSPPPLATNLGLRRDPELGLLSLLFVISVAMGAFFSLAVISLPALRAFRRLAVSVDELSKVVSEEVPGTLSSLKLSGLEINDLTCQLNNLRQRISGNQYVKKVRTNKSTSCG
ncbi:hypothetical protein COCNU_scaffold004282G000010 [Cocos nucifera]|nr:hypothetical protein [Cocos nucifera]